MTMRSIQQKKTQMSREKKINDRKNIQICLLEAKGWNLPAQSRKRWRQLYCLEQKWNLHVDVMQIISVHCGLTLLPQNKKCMLYVFVIKNLSINPKIVFELEYGTADQKTMQFVQFLKIYYYFYLIIVKITMNRKQLLMNTK